MTMIPISSELERCVWLHLATRYGDSDITRGVAKEILRTLEVKGYLKEGARDATQRPSHTYT